MAEEKSDIFPEKSRTCKDDTVQLTPQEWEDVAEFLLELGELIERQIMSETVMTDVRAEAITKMRRMMNIAAGAALYVGCYAEEKCVFSIRAFNEGYTDDEKREEN